MTNQLAAVKELTALLLNCQLYTYFTTRDMEPSTFTKKLIYEIKQVGLQCLKNKLLPVFVTFVCLHFQHGERHYFISLRICHFSFTLLCRTWFVAKSTKFLCFLVQWRVHYFKTWKNVRYAVARIYESLLR